VHNSGWELGSNNLTCHNRFLRAGSDRHVVDQSHQMEERMGAGDPYLEGVHHYCDIHHQTKTQGRMSRNSASRYHLKMGENALKMSIP
jgi:hypothetical protein